MKNSANGQIESNILFFIFMIPLFLLFFLTSFSLQADEFDIENRGIGELPGQCDERINGYREDYKKIDKELIQLPSKYKKKGKKSSMKDEKKPETTVEKSLTQTPADETKTPENLPLKNKKPEEKPAFTEKPAEANEPKTAPGYYGETFDGVRDGKGKLVLANGDVYDGHWKEGKKDGHGVYVYASGVKYNGTWRSDKMDGYGSLLFPDGSSYYGEFSEGEISGTGTFNYTDKAQYTGEWSKGKWHGEGRFRLANGRELHAIFAEQQIVQIISELPEAPEKTDTELKNGPENTGQGPESGAALQ